MKKILYVVMFVLGGLVISNQSVAQRNNNVKQYKKQAKKVQKRRVQAYKSYQHSTGKNYNNQYKYNNVHRGNTVVTRRRIVTRRQVVPWANRRNYQYEHHVYFPDYHAFYDPRRGGYVYQNRGRWVFSTSIPVFLAGVNWNNARIEYMNNVPLNVYPETYYNTYSRRYPAVSLNIHIGL